MSRLQNACSLWKESQKKELNDCLKHKVTFIHPDGNKEEITFSGNDVLLPNVKMLDVGLLRVGDDVLSRVGVRPLTLPREVVVPPSSKEQIEEEFKLSFFERATLDLVFVGFGQSGKYDNTGHGHYISDDPKSEPTKLAGFIAISMAKNFFIEYYNATGEKKVPPSHIKYTKNSMCRTDRISFIPGQAIYISSGDSGGPLIHDGTEVTGIAVSATKDFLYNPDSFIYNSMKDGLLKSSLKRIDEWLEKHHFENVKFLMRKFARWGFSLPDFSVLWETQFQPIAEKDIKACFTEL